VLEGGSVAPRQAALHIEFVSYLKAVKAGTIDTSPTTDVLKVSAL
jgi:hypothetical protein